jgi:general L-amino acid transport system permease protein
LLTIVGIVFSFPIGVLLALGRRSNLPVVRWFSIGYIELVRGVPLISILFMAQLMLPLFLPANMTVDRVLRAMVGITLFSAAYLAENVRGGLQAIPKGQFEAAFALGLGSAQTMIFIILPQALRLIIPILVGQFISLFKDTSLVSIVGLLDLVGIGKTVLAQPEFLGLQREVYAFISLLYWVLSYAMSYMSQRLEVSLGVGER